MRKISNLSDSEDEYWVSTEKEKEKVCNKVKININAVPIKADVNIIDEEPFVKLKGKVTLKKSNAKLFG